MYYKYILCTQAFCTDYVYYYIFSKEHSELINSINFEVVTTFESQYVKAIKALWADSGVRHCYDRKREYQLIDSAK